MKHKIISILSIILLATTWALAQAPTMTFDGTKLRVMVPEGYLELKRDAIGNDAIIDCFAWAEDGSCLFMAQPGPFVFEPKELTQDGPIVIDGMFNGEPIKIAVERVEPSSGGKGASTNTEPGLGKKIDTTLLLIIGIVGLLLVLLVVFMILKKKKKKVHDTSKETNDPNIISVITDESVKYEKGMRHVTERINEYLTFDMDMVFADTAVNKVYINTGLIKKLYDFFNGSLETGGRTNETGCFILGCWDYEGGRRDRYNISLEEMVEPGDDADFGEYSLNFGKKISVNMASVIDNLQQKSKRDYVLTCWMHSHPGLGLFLSNQDLVVQQQLTYSDHRNRLIAIVIDTNTPDFKLGFFTAKTDGKMNNKEEVKRWFSFEEIYRESRELNRNQHIHSGVGNDVDNHPESFNIALNDNAITQIGFAPHVINQIDHTLYAGVKGVVGYFYGEMENHCLQVGCCLPYENEERLGCLIFADGLNESQLINYANDIVGCRFLINSTSDDNLVVWTKNDQGGFTPVGKTTLSQMKEWIRRKRV